MLTAAVAIALFASTQSHAGHLEIRTSKVEITPSEPLPLGGYTARGGKKSDPGGETLFARTIIFSAGTVRFAVVSVEMLTIPESLARDVEAKSGMPIFLAATHTHCAPDSQMLNDRMSFGLPGIARFDGRWLQWYSDRIAEGVRTASFSSPRPVSDLGAAIWRVDANRGRRRLADPDKTATLLKAGTEPIVFHYSAHAVFYGPERNQASGDWPGKTERLAFLTLVGAIGDVSPAADGASPDAKIERFWSVQESGAGQAKQIEVGAAPLELASVPIDLPETLHWTLFAMENRIPEPLAKSIVERFAPKEAKITAFRIGKLCVVGVPGEPTAALGRRIRDEGRRIGFEPVLVCSHVNGWAGYILEAEDYARGGYEASLDFYGPEMAERVYEASVRSMRQLAGIGKR